MIGRRHLGFIRRLVCCLTALAAVAMPAPAHAQPQAAFGLSDENPAAFSGDAFTAVRARLGIQYARLVVPYDVLAPGAAQRYGCSTIPDCAPRNLLEWVAAVSRAHLRPLITLGLSQCFSPQCIPVPPVHGASGFGANFQRLVKAFPQVHDWAPWNEPDSSPITRSEPELIADFWITANRIEHQLHRNDVLVAGELVSLAADRSHFFKRYSHWLWRRGGHPAVWGFHPYGDVIWRQTSDTRSFLAATPQGSQVWLTESGVVVNDWAGLAGLPDIQAQAAATFLQLGRLSPRITRNYYYQLQALGRPAFDSALLDNNGVPRPAFCVLANLPQNWCLGSTYPFGN